MKRLLLLFCLFFSCHIFSQISKGDIIYSSDKAVFKYTVLDIGDDKLVWQKDFKLSSGVRTTKKEEYKKTEIDGLFNYTRGGINYYVNIEDNMSIFSIQSRKVVKLHILNKDKKAVKGDRSIAQNQAESIVKKMFELQDAQRLEEKSKVEIPENKYPDPEMEKKILKAFEEYYDSKGYDKSKYLKTVIFPYDEWKITRNTNTGVITGRMKEVIILYQKKNSEGLCSYTYQGFQQQYNGSGYEPDFIYFGPGKNILISCDKLDPYRE